MSDSLSEIEHRVERLERAMWPMNYPQQPFMPMPVGPVAMICSKCGLKWEGATGYVCSANDCPIQPKVT